MRCSQHQKGLVRRRGLPCLRLFDLVKHNITAVTNPTDSLFCDGGDFAQCLLGLRLKGLVGLNALPCNLEFRRGGDVPQNGLCLRTHSIDIHKAVPCMGKGTKGSCLLGERHKGRRLGCGYSVAVCLPSACLGQPQPSAPKCG